MRRSGTEQMDLMRNASLKRLATRPASLSIDSIIDEIEDTIFHYIFAIYQVNPETLPVKSMGEGIYRAAVAKIQEEGKKRVYRNVEELNILETQLLDYDNSSFHTVTDLNFDVLYIIRGTQYYPYGEYPFAYRRAAEVAFHYDERMGWILLKCISDRDAAQKN